MVNVAGFFATHQGTNRSQLIIGATEIQYTYQLKYTFEYFQTFFEDCYIAFMMHWNISKVKIYYDTLVCFKV